VRVLAEIPARPAAELRAGSLRRRDVEAFERLRTGLGASCSVLMTGAARERRAVAVGLAAAAAASGARTALLECDLARPGLADALGLANAPGLHEYLTGTATVERILKPVALAGPGSAAASEPLVCVCAGRPSPEGPRLFATDRFASAVEGLGAAYELLVIDGPPLDDWASLSLLPARVEATVACLSPSEADRPLPIPVLGIVVQA
jgi:Mrp family chromosome partitioning ATPase